MLSTWTMPWVGEIWEIHRNTMKIKDCWTYIATMAPPIWGPPFYGHKRVISLSSPSSAPDSTAATQQRGQLLLNLGTEMVREIRGKQHVKPIFAKYLWNILEKMLYIYIYVWKCCSPLPTKFQSETSLGVSLEDRLELASQFRFLIQIHMAMLPAL
jgi:hypothetical protein